MYDRQQQDGPTRHGAGSEESLKVADYERLSIQGVHGWQIWGGLVYSDPNADFEPYSARGLYADHGIYQRMARRDPVLRGATMTYTELLKSATYEFEEPDNATELEKETTEFAQWCIENVEGGIPHIIESAAQQYIYGFWLQEIGLRMERGAFNRPMFVLGRLFDLLPWSVDKWIYHPSKRVVAVQQTWASSEEGMGAQIIPLGKCVLYTHGFAENGPEGVAMLRPAYFAWTLKEEILERDAGVWEKWGYGVPIFNQVSERADAGALTKMGEIAADYRSHPNGFLAGLFGYTVALEFPAHQIPDPSARIEMLNKEMLMGYLAMSIVDGSTPSGSRNVIDSQLSFFHQAAQHRAESIARNLDTRGRPGSGVIPNLIKMNYFLPPGFRYPKIRVTGIREKNVTEWVANVTALAQARIINPDREIENTARKEVSLPERDEVTDMERDAVAPGAQEVTDG